VLGVVSRFRVLIVAFSVAVFVFLFGFANLCCVPWSVGWLRLVDLAFWILSMGSMFAGFAEFWLFWRESSVLSTLLIDVAGLGIVVFARFSSAIYSLLKTSFYVQVVGGSIVDEVSYRLASLAVLGSFMIFSSTSLSTWFREPVVFAKSLTFHDLFTRLVKSLCAVDIRWMYIASFAAGFLVRFYSELKYLDLPIGWDTLEYIAVARDFASTPKLLTSYLWLGGWRNLPPLITWVSGEPIATRSVFRLVLRALASPPSNDPVTVPGTIPALPSVSEPITTFSSNLLCLSTLFTSSGTLIATTAS
jgi:hypothetical protein